MATAPIRAVASLTGAPIPNDKPMVRAGAAVAVGAPTARGAGGSYQIEHGWPHLAACGPEPQHLGRLPAVPASYARAVPDRLPDLPPARRTLARAARCPSSS